MVASVDGQPIDPLWIAEFCGFFMAEGTLGIYCATRPNRPRGGESYYATACVAQRADNAAVLRDIQQKFGGTFTTLGHISFTNPQAYNYLRKPQLVWRTQKAETIRAILAILRTSRMPHQWKADLFGIMDEFLAIPRVRGQHICPNTLEQMRGLYHAAKEAHRYREVTT